MNIKAFVLPALLLFSAAGYCSADTIVLKSGKEVAGRILEDTADYIKIDYQGAPLYYDKKYILVVKPDGNKPSNGSGPAEAASPGEKEITVTPAAADTLLKQGLESAARGSFAEARGSFEKGLKADGIDPNFQGALTILDDLDKGKINKEFASALFKGSYYLMIQDYRKAIANLEEAAKLRPEDPNIFYNLAVAHENAHEEEAALKCLARVLELDPEDAEAYSMTGTVYYAKSDYAKARANFILAREIYKKKGDENKFAEIDDLLKEF